MSATAELERIEAAGFVWWVRPRSSDWSSIREVAVRRAYFTRSFAPEEGELWLDGGANIGAFAVVVAAAGAGVVAYEPWPENAALARANLRANGLEGRVLEKAIGLEAGIGRLGLAKAHWRHSLLRPSSDHYPVPVVSFAEAVAGCDCAKLDIEGAELAILAEAEMPETLRKLTFEWHFDYERDTTVYHAALERLRDQGFEVRGRKVPPGVEYHWYPPAALVRCWR